MTTMTIHADDALAEAIRKGAADAGQSISKFIQTTMGTALGVFKRKERVRVDTLAFLFLVAENTINDVLFLEREGVPKSLTIRPLAVVLGGRCK